MRNGLYVTDFHVHLRGQSNELINFCHEDQQSPMFQKTIKLFERVANLSERFHELPVRHMAINHRGLLSRYVYASFGQVLLMEAIRLFKNYDLQGLLTSMNRNDIDHAVVVSLEPFITTQEILDVVQGHEDRISVFASVARCQQDPAAYFESFLNSGRIAGLKIHPVVGGYACGEIYHATKDYVALAVERKLPILIHTGHIPKAAVRALAHGCNEVRALEPLIKAFPDGRFVLAHIGWESWRQVLELAQRYPQVMVETSWQSARVIRRAVDTLGPHRVIFGSDFPLLKQNIAYNLLEEALTPRELVMVASTNTRRLLNLQSLSRAA
jgi:predicted TIM-barrel fold metal-dependent hydrolase